MNISHFFTVIYLSFYSKRLYQTVYRTWSGYNLQFLLLVTALAISPSALHWLNQIYSINTHYATADIDQDESDNQDIQPNSNYALQNIIEQMPVMTIQNGTLLVDTHEPYFITDPISKKVVIIIDTSGKTILNETSPALALITKKEITIRPWQGKNMHYYIADLFDHNKPVIITHETIRDWIDAARSTLLWFIPLVLFPVNVLVIFLYSTLRVFLYALSGFVITSFNLSRKMNYEGLVRIAVIASIPPTLLATLNALIISTYAIPLKHLEFGPMLLSIGYFIFALRSCLELPDNTSIPAR